MLFEVHWLIAWSLLHWRLTTEMGIDLVSIQFWMKAKPKHEAYPSRYWKFLGILDNFSCYPDMSQWRMYYLNQILRICTEILSHKRSILMVYSLQIKFSTSFRSQNCKKRIGYPDKFWMESFNWKSQINGQKSRQMEGGSAKF